MTQEQIIKVSEMQKQGFSYKQISDVLQVSVNTIRSYCVRHSKPRYFCQQCGEEIYQNEGRREKKFCSSRCRSAWWNIHRNERTLDNKYLHKCPVCGRRFLGYGDRVYCSLQCYAEARKQRNE